MANLFVLLNSIGSINKKKYLFYTYKQGNTIISYHELKQYIDYFEIIAL